MQSTLSDRSAASDDLIAFINASPTPYHAVQSVQQRLEAKGYRRLDAAQPWQINPGDKIYLSQGDGTLAAFWLGSKAPCETGFCLIGAHTDSPNLRIKPQADMQTHGVRQLGVEIYGGVLLSTWLDRDLALAGRVYWHSKQGPTQALVNINQALLRIPNLAIHLNRQVNQQGLQLNPQQHMVPLYALAGGDTPDLRSLLADALTQQGINVAATAITSWDLALYDSQPASYVGHAETLISAGRLDNLASCHAGLCALLRLQDAPAQSCGIVLYDHEECGSRSHAGAQSAFLQHTLRRLSEAYSPDNPQGHYQAMARSWMISADMAHALHPNYPERHDAQHRPKLGLGPVIKTNVNQAYATDAETQALFQAACRKAKVQTQHFVSRNDTGCGSTIGPISAARLGIRCVDVGNPMLAMHSCREMAATCDVEPMIKAMHACFDSEL